MSVSLSETTSHRIRESYIIMYICGRVLITIAEKKLRKTISDSGGDSARKRRKAFFAGSDPSERKKQREKQPNLPRKRPRMPHLCGKYGGKAEKHFPGKRGFSLPEKRRYMEPVMFAFREKRAKKRFYFSRVHSALPRTHTSPNRFRSSCQIISG